MFNIAKATTVIILTLVMGWMAPAAIAGDVVSYTPASPPTETLIEESSNVDDSETTATRTDRDVTLALLTGADDAFDFTAPFKEGDPNASAKVPGKSSSRELRQWLGADFRTDYRAKPED